MFLCLFEYKFNDITVCGEPYMNNTGCPTSFPHGLALGATFNRSLWHAIGEAISDEARALHNQNNIAGLYLWSFVTFFFSGGVFSLYV